MTTPQVLHTFFGDPQRPLFGAFHVPASQTARGAVVIAPALGKEQGDTTRGQRLLAELLAADGLAALRFDYLYTGESWGDQDDPSAAAALAPSLQSAIDYVRSTGAPQVAVVGLRAGALIAGQLDATTLDTLAALVLWDPVPKGSTYVRAERLLYQAAFDDASDLGDHVHLIGASWHRDAIDELRAMTVPASLSSSFGSAIAVATHDPGGPAVGKLVADGAQVIDIADPANFVKPDSFFVELPTDAARSIAGWLSPLLTGPESPIRPELRTAAVMSAPDAPTRVTTRVAKAVNGVVTWITEPADEPVTQVLATHSTANDIRTGPGRLWVEAGRRLACNGVRTIRYDRFGIGESGEVDARDDYRPIHSEQSVSDAIAVTPTDQAVVHAGVCSGGWVAARAALDVDHPGGNSAAVLVNHLMWRRHTTPFSRDELMRMGVSATAESKGASGTTFFYRYRAKLQPIVSRLLPFWGYRLLGRLRIAQVPDQLLRVLARHHVTTELVFSPDDYALFRSQRAGASLKSLARRGWTANVVVSKAGDHAALHWQVREAAEQACRSALASVRPRR